MNGMQSAMAEDDVIDPSVAAVLEQLWVAYQENPGKPWTLAKLAKRARLPMSALRRTLTLLKAASLVDYQLDEEGRGFADLTEQGVALCAVATGSASGALTHSRHQD